MTRITVVTSFGAAGLDLYGYAFLETFRRFWPKEVELRVYVDDDVPSLDEWVNRLPLQQVSLRCADFLQRHQNNPVAQGRQRAPGKIWTQRRIDRGYNFRFDAYKFCRKVFAIEHAVQTVREGKLFWLDADVITHTPVPLSLLQKVLPDGVAMSCLSRPHIHSECGFVGYNLSHWATHQFVRAFADLYATDAVFELDEWHDSWVFDYLREKYSLLTHPIYSGPAKRKGHVFNDSVLGRYMDHMKGTVRKELGYSPESKAHRPVGLMNKIAVAIGVPSAAIRKTS